MRLIILAPPGAGKGTQAEMLSKHFSIPTISAGAMLRKNIQDGTQLGDIAAKYINDGKFVPDDVIIDMVKSRLSESDCKDGFILDGFPRNLEQANALKNSDIKIDRALYLSVSDETIIERVSGRLECSECGAAYHEIHRKPEKDGVCDLCGGSLNKRADDKPETVKERLKTYHEKTEPLITFYKNEGILRTAYGKEGIDDTTKEVLSVLED